MAPFVPSLAYEAVTLTRSTFQATAERPTRELYQRVRIGSIDYEVRCEGDLLCSVSLRGGSPHHLLSSRLCACGRNGCTGRLAVTLAKVLGLMPFVPLNPSDRPVDSTVFQTLPLTVDGDHAICVVDVRRGCASVSVYLKGHAEHHEISVDACSCGGEDCYGSQLLSMAKQQGLAVSFDPRPDVYRRVAGSRDCWEFEAPYGLAPRWAPGRMYVSRARGSLIFTEYEVLVGQRTVRASRSACSVDEIPCLHTAFVHLLAA
jgi:hypothetical protein